LTVGLTVTAGPNAVAADDAGAARLAQDRSPQQPEEMPPTPSKPVRVFTDGQGRTCQVYRHEVSIDKAPQTAYAIICQLQNGRWVLVR
jgi:hypothetical protein